MHKTIPLNIHAETVLRKKKTGIGKKRSFKNTYMVRVVYADLEINCSGSKVKYTMKPYKYPISMLKTVNFYWFYYLGLI